MPNGDAQMLAEELTDQPETHDSLTPPLHSWIAPATQRTSTLDPARLEYRLCAPREAAREPHVREAYRVWRQVWSATFGELDGNNQLFSDDFTRQDEHSALFQGSECVGLNAHRWVDFTDTAFDDSYFKPWPRSAAEAVAEVGLRACIGSYLTVPRAYRGRQAAVSVKDLLLTLSVARFLKSEADVLVGTLRNNRGMNQLGYRLGARAIALDVTHHGVSVDLVLWDRSVRPFDAWDGPTAELGSALLNRALSKVTP